MLIRWATARVNGVFRPVRGTAMLSTVFDFDAPFNLSLSLEAAASFYPREPSAGPDLRVAIPNGPHPAIIEIRQLKKDRNSMLRASANARISNSQLNKIARRLVAADLDLRHFYALARHHRVLGPVTALLRGLKPLPPYSVFEMAVIAITEQQLSLAAAYRIRTRIVHRFGVPVEDLWLFPSPARLANAPERELAECGLSGQKTSYVKALARRVATGDLDLERLSFLSDNEVRAALMDNPGLGRWSAEYVLLRGLGRPAGLPATDISLQRVVGLYLAQGRRLTSAELERALSPFAPFHGLAAFYLSVAFRRRLRGNGGVVA
jgi:DNA-3-methyladenine glycosylase II